jgi:hypothetical protein
MELYELENLYFRIQNTRRFTEEEALPIMARLVGAVHYLHCLGYVHNGISLGHILLQDTGLPVLTGWSRMRRVAARSDFPPEPPPDLELWEDPALQYFKAPEIASDVNPIGTYASDVWSLGKCFEQMVDQEICSPDFLDLVRGMTADAPDERLAIEDVSIHQLFAEVPSENCSAAEHQMIARAQEESESFQTFAGA